MPERIRRTLETFESEGLKSVAAEYLHVMAKNQISRRAIGLVAGGPRVEDDRLRIQLAGMDFENPLVVGAGWDEDGRAVDGLYMLGFAGTEVGTVTMCPQFGNSRPRLFIDKATKSVALNSMGFNNPGMEEVEINLSKQHRLGIIGVSIGKNKLTPDEKAATEYSAVASKLYDCADYLVINAASPNTPGLRNLLKKEPLAEIIDAVIGTFPSRFERKPLFVKTTVDLSLDDLDEVLEVCLEKGVDGIIDTNTTTDESIKTEHGWAGQPGGVSGNDPRYRLIAVDRMKYITEQTRDINNFYRIGVGGINDTDTALERLRAGAQMLQVVTGIRQRKGRVAREINSGLLSVMERDGVSQISDYVGVDI